MALYKYVYDYDYDYDFTVGNFGDICYSLSSSMLLRDVILTSFSVYLFTVSVIFSLCKTRAHRARATVGLLC